MKVLFYSQTDEKVEELFNLVEELSSGSVERTDNKESFLEQLRVEEYDLCVILAKEANQCSGLLGMITADYKDLPILCLLENEAEEEALKLFKYGAGDVVYFSEAKKEHLVRVIERLKARAFSAGQLETKMSDFVLTNSFDGILALDLHMRVLLWNRSMERMFAKKRADVLGKIAHEILPFEGIDQELKRALDGESFAGVRKVFVNRDQKRYYQPFYAPLISRTGSRVGVMGIFRDLTELVEKESLNQQLQERISKVANSLPQMLWFANPKGERNFFNKKYLEFVGTKKTHLLNEGWLMAVRPDQRAMYARVLTDAVEKKRGFHLEYQMLNKDNIYRRIMDSCAPITDEAGKFLGLIGYCTDMSESGTTLQKMDSISTTRSFSEMSGKRRAHKEQISSTMENAPLGVWKLDRDLKITTVSRSAAAQLGCLPEELKGKKFTDTIKNIPEASLLEVLEQRSSFQLNAHEIDTNGDSSDKARFWDIAAWPLLDRTKDVIGVCLSTIEVERQEDKGKEAFVATLVHDLKTPLIGADRTLELLIDGSMGEFETPQSEVLSMLQRSNRGLLRMVQNLIEVYRYDFAKPKFDFVSTSLFDLALECVNELSALAEEKNVNLEANLLEGLGIVEVDEIAVRRVIINLIDNAIKFTPQGGNVRVWGEQTPNMVTVYIKDNGIGIAPDEIPKVFDKFWRSPTNTGQAVGTGLGLYLCKQVIDAHQGEISVEPGQDQGTLMRISLNIGS